ncbi:MAG: 4Fe-4S dicluster domain-containing protein [Candidatus Omnitrophota bacterium]|jgi:MinD superfamily P-loop ATPase|nr:MAG: 4Fe-4S dicluster domain-containing protein [Candidatus Omnitrophota bacterium]
MKELAVISGKGGTGKTGMAASLAALAQNKIVVDCDVDAANLHIILEPTIQTEQIFIGSQKATIQTEQCSACGECEAICAFDAVHSQPSKNGTNGMVYHIDAMSCEGCGVCAHFCPAGAIAMNDNESGRWFLSQTRFGPMVHARLGIAENNSGRLVSLIREQARQWAQRDHYDLILIDGPPGIGCPVIASITGVDLVLIMTEPTLSGLHDLERVRDLTRHFNIPTVVCINKFDLNLELTAKIEQTVQHMGIKTLGKIAFDRVFTEAQIQKLSVIEYSNGTSSQEIRILWNKLKTFLSEDTP